MNCKTKIQTIQTINHFQIGLLIGKTAVLLTPNKTPHQILKKMHKKIHEQKNNSSNPINGKYEIKFIHNHNSPQKNNVIGNSKNDNKFQIIK